MGLAAAVAGVGAAASIGGALISSSASKNASQTQANAANNAAQTQLNMYNQTVARLDPYNQTGIQANNQLAQTPAFNFAPTQANLENTPGYQFNLTQGLKATQNSAAARGLGVSGAALKGAAGYASGLASGTYQQQFQNALEGYTTNLNKLQGQASIGENAAANAGNFGTQTAQAIGQAQVGAANASAAGQIGQANAFSNGLNGVTGALTTGAYLGSGMYGGGGGNSLFGFGGGGQNPGAINAFNQTYATSQLPISADLTPPTLSFSG